MAQFQDPLQDGLLGDDVIAPIFGHERLLWRLKAIALAFAVACEAEKLISRQAADAISRLIVDFRPAQEALRDGIIRRDGALVPTCLRQLEDLIGSHEPQDVKRMRASQDLLDTSLVLALRYVNLTLTARLERLSAGLANLSAVHGHERLTARCSLFAVGGDLPAATRIGAWRSVVTGLSADLAALRPTVEALQFGGPLGDRDALGPAAARVAEHMAAALDLSDPGAGWHTDRSRLAAYAAWLARLGAGLGKIGADVDLMSQHGVDEIAFRPDQDGGPQNRDSVEASALVAFARYQAAQCGAFHQTLVHEQERAHTSLILEGMILPGLCIVAGAATCHALRLVERIEAMGDTARARYAA